MSLLRKSDWAFDASATGGVGYGLLAASGGKISLTDPSNQSHDFFYTGYGIGFSKAIQKIEIPPLPILNRAISVTGSTENFHSGGFIYMTNSFGGKELVKSDLQGGTVYLDAGGGLLAGFGGSIMLLGINVTLLASCILNPGLFASFAKNLIEHAPAVLVMGGVLEGLISSIVGAGAMVGYLQ